MRIRSIYPAACDSEKLGAVSGDAERLYFRLQMHCDDEGRAEDNPRLIFGRCGPLVDGWNAQVVDDLLAELDRADLIERYEAEGRAYLQVTKWIQKPQKPIASDLPAPPGTTAEPDSFAYRDNNDTRTVADQESSGRVSLPSGEEGRGEEGRGRGERDTGTRSDAPTRASRRSRSRTEPPDLVESGAHVAQLVAAKIAQHRPTAPAPPIDAAAAAAGDKLLRALARAADPPAALAELPQVLDWALGSSAHWCGRITSVRDLPNAWAKLHADYLAAQKRTSAAAPIGPARAAALAAAASRAS